MREGMSLSDVQFWFLTAFYVVLAVLSSATWAIIVLYHDLPSTLPLGFIAEITCLTAISVSSVYYIRKLYKDKFAMDLGRSNRKTSTTATFAYFVTRPIFAILTSMFFVFTLCGVIMSSTANFSGFSSNFFIHVSAMSALVSVLTGRSIQRLEGLAS